MLASFSCYRFQRDKRELPVLWHQALLTFVQRYKEDISSEQKEALMELLRAHTHELITPEIRRELVHSKCRDVEGEMPQGSGAMEEEEDWGRGITQGLAYWEVRGGGFVNSVFVNSLWLLRNVWTPWCTMLRLLQGGNTCTIITLSCFHIDISYGNWQVKSTRRSA